jgi:hypothetical protein
MTDNQSKTKQGIIKPFGELRLFAFGIGLAFIGHHSSAIRHAFILKISKLILA